MTKSIIITYSEADESFLMTLFKRFKIKIQEVQSPNGDKDNDKLMEARLQMDNKEYQEVSMDELYQLIHN